ncbi:capsule assembly Wzi family protein [Dyadobacter sp. Leaf189]|uniref:capsule assembly Wzi family protein n=1 Tax=Dyadobacter sp. Leaf189 TaxID=1736295 RepID=UPI0006F84421|nr:capsule assembly Wzi family protein [Dyadobacter sp. Leaf189]KQS30704.1 hypothetical protein ASG33_09945 [Dyadobacter sp. Leaf189]
MKIKVLTCKYLYVILAICTTTGTSASNFSADSIVQKPISATVEVSALVATSSRTPFWFHANKYGSVPTSNPFTSLNASITREYKGKRLDWGFGFQGVAYLGKKTGVVIPEGYLKGGFGKLEIWGGRRKRIIGIVGDSTLTSGSYIQSGNSTPIPQIQIGFMEYVPLFKGLLSFKGMISHGWFDKNKIVKNHYLHQKNIYIKLGKVTWPVRVAGGFNHNVQWGGTVVTPNRYTVGKHYPSEWIDYWYVFSGKRIPTFGFVDPTKYDVIDRGNRVGNHLGSLDLSVEATLGRSELILYRQFIYDDGSLYYKKGYKDGLYGLTMKFNSENIGSFRIKAFTTELLYTLDQGGSTFALDGTPRGRDDYFNHTQYSGWVYSGSTIGTPFIVPKEQTNPSLPRNNVFRFSNNTRTKLIHIAFMGSIKKTEFIVKASYSDNRGTYEARFPDNADQLSLFLDTNIPLQSKLLGQLNVHAGLAADLGKLYMNSSGVKISVVKTIF